MDKIITSASAYIMAKRRFILSPTNKKAPEALI